MAEAAGSNPQIYRPGKILRQHFFRRFFDNDTMSVEGETETSVIRALALCAVPSLMVAFWLLPSYPGPPRPFWAVEADRYFFVLYGFVVMGVVTTFEWEMLFPDRADFLILLPLPLQALELFYAKIRALLTFLGMFLVATNLFSLILYSAVSTRSHGNYLHTVVAHFCAVMLAGVFAAFSMLALEGVSIAVLPDKLLRFVSPLMQSISIAALLLLLLLFPVVSSRLQLLLDGHSAIARFIPPLWFLGVYERLALGAAAPAAADGLARIGLMGTAVAMVLALVSYPAAWARQKRRALEGASTVRGKRFNLVTWGLQRTLLRRPQQRAIFHFVTQTISRNTHYQVFLAVYAGVGLALVLASVLTLRVVAGQGLAVALSNNGLHAVLPLSLFWLVVGLRSAFAFPVDMRARWVFPINLPPIGPVFLGAAKSAKTWVLLCAGVMTVVVVEALILVKWPWWDLFVQMLFGIGLSVLLADLFFLGRTQIPFTRARMPGRSSLPIVLTLYAALFPALVLLTVKWELLCEVRPAAVIWMVVSFVLSHLVLKAVDRLAQRGIIGGFPEDETDPGPQTLGLLPSTQREGNRTAAKVMNS